MPFALHSRLAADTVLIGALPLSRVLLMNDMNFPWCVLVPVREGIREIHDLEEADQLQLMREMAGVAGALQDACRADKMNVAALGNVVPQLHVHIIARFETDPAWPAPVWGRLPAKPYPFSDLKQQVARFQMAFHPIPEFRTNP